MPLGRATIIPYEVDYFSLVTPADMMECLQVLPLIDYWGTIGVGAAQGSPGLIEWTMVARNNSQPGSPTVTCTLNDVLVWDGINLDKMSLIEFQDKYTVV